MIRNDTERRRSQEELEYLQHELESIIPDQQDDISKSVESGLSMRISDIEDRIAEYDRLNEGQISIFEGESLDDLGEVIIKARIRRGWSQAELARALDMEPQQVQRYERNDWQKISLWRLQEVAEVLGLNVSIRGRLGGHEIAYPTPFVRHLHHIWDAQGLGQRQTHSWRHVGEGVVGLRMGEHAIIGTEPNIMTSALHPQIYRTDESGGIGYEPPEKSQDVLGTTLLLQGDHG